MSAALLQHLSDLHKALAVVCCVPHRTSYTSLLRRGYDDIHYALMCLLRRRVPVTCYAGDCSRCFYDAFLILITAAVAKTIRSAVEYSRSAPDRPRCASVPSLSLLSMQSIRWPALLHIIHDNTPTPPERSCPPGMHSCHYLGMRAPYLGIS